MTQHIPEIPDETLDDFIARNVFTPVEQQRAEEELRRADNRVRWAGVLFAFLVILGAWCATASAQSVPFDSTTKGRIVVSCGGSEIGQHVVETEATAHVIDHAVKNGGKASCVLTYPQKLVVVNLPGVGTPPPPPPVCPPKPADLEQIGTCPAGSTGSWPQTRTHVSAPAPKCWVPVAEWTPATPPDGACVVDLAAPADLKALRVDSAIAGRHDVRLSWSPVAGAVTYRIERCTGPTCSVFSELIKGLATPSYPNTNLPPDRVFKYRVQAEAAGRPGPFSGVVVAEIPPTAPPPASELTAPAGLTAIRVDTTTPDRYDIKLAWGAVAGAATYRIEVCTEPTCVFGELAKGVTSLAHTHSALPPGLTYRYRVRAETATASGPFSGVAIMETPPAAPPPPPPPATGAATLRWVPPTANTDDSPLTNLAGYKIYVSSATDPPGGRTVIAVPDPGTSTYVVDGLAVGTWTFRVAALTAAGAEGRLSDPVTKVVQ